MSINEEENKKGRFRALLPYIYLALPFLLMDLGVRFLAQRVTYFRPAMVLPAILFTLMWTGLFAALSLSLTKRAGRLLYSLIFLIFFLLFLTNCIYFPYTGYFFGFNILMMAGEGSSYIVDTIKGASPLLWVYSAAVIATYVFVMKSSRVRNAFPEKAVTKRIIITFVSFLVLHLITPLLLGKRNTGLEWDTWRNPRNVYENFNDANKNMKIEGLFEYTFRDLYVSFFKPEDKASEEEEQFLNDQYASASAHDSNDMSGIFKGKNLIILQLEGMDSWLLNEEDTPNLYTLLNDGISFTEHYSFYNGGGSTFNSELCVNTGFVTPVSFIRNAYTFSSNYLPYTLPKMFSAEGYSVDAFHMNTEEYYSRGINYKNWGYDHYYGLLDMEDFEKNDLSYELDRTLMENETFRELILGYDGPFVKYIITYTPHTPFSSEKGLGAYLLDLNGERVNEPLTEEEVARLFAAETDRFVGLLLDGLKEKNMLEDCVIAAFADHYLYTLEDKSILEKNKAVNSAGFPVFDSDGGSNNLINNTPFFIWADGLKKDVCGKVNSQLDILPTLLNLFGIDYCDENYIGSDIFDPDYQGYVFFNDYSWYDGSAAPDESSSDNRFGSLIKKNDLTLKYDYFRTLSNLTP